MTPQSRPRIALFGRLFPAAGPEELVEIAARLGYGGVDIRCDAPLPSGAAGLPAETPPARLRDLKRRLDGQGLVVSCLYTWTGAYLRRKDDAERQRQLDDLARRIDLAQALDCSLLQHGPGGDSRRASDDDFQTAAHWLRRAGELARARGVRLAMEGGENMCESAASTQRLFDLVGADLGETIGVIYDPANMLTRETDYGPAAVRQLFPRIFQVHLKDERRVERPPAGSRWPFVDVPLGDGDVDWPPVLRTLRDDGYAGWFACEGLPELEAEARARGELAGALRLTRDAGFGW